MEKAASKEAIPFTLITIGYGNSDTRHGFYFTLLDAYGSGNITFDCECYTQDKQMIHLGDMPVDFGYMEKARAIAAKHNFAKMKPRIIDINQPAKREHRGIDLYWADNRNKHQELRTDYWPRTGAPELLTLFWELVNALMGEGRQLPLRAEDIIELSYGARELPPYGSYELREEKNGKITLSWPSHGGKSGDDIYTNTVTVDDMYMERLREIVKCCGILAPKPGVLRSLPADENLYRYKEEIKPPHLEVHWRAVPQSYGQFDWNRNSWIRLSQPASGGEALLEFLRGLAINNARKAKTKFSHRSGPTK